MGECGCGKTIPYKIVKVGKNILVVEIYKGCEYCSTGLMVTLHIMTSSEAKTWDWKPEGIFKPDEFGYAQMNFPLVGPEDLVEIAKEMNPDFTSGNGYESLEEWLEENGLEFLQRSVQRHLVEIDKNIHNF